MKHILTPVHIDTHPFRESLTSDKNVYSAIILDTENTWVFGDNFGCYSTPEEALADPLANELVRAINAHDALVEALEHMIPRYCEMFKECGLGDPKMSAYVQAAQAALRLAKGEHE